MHSARRKLTSEVAFSYRGLNSGKWYVSKTCGWDWVWNQRLPWIGTNPATIFYPEASDLRSSQERVACCGAEESFSVLRKCTATDGDKYQHGTMPITDFSSAAKPMSCHLISSHFIKHLYLFLHPTRIVFLLGSCPIKFVAQP